ncbi:MAG: hypothetical protein Q4Q62_08470 [Thermoplasmata archaeon]|nr:hypothetical protein [Thermoplasmata archaeon]
MDMDRFMSESVQDRFDTDGPVELGNAILVDDGNGDVFQMIPGLRKIWRFTVARNPATLALRGEIECDLNHVPAEGSSSPARQLGSFPRRIYTLRLFTDRGPCHVVFSNMLCIEMRNRTYLHMDIASLEIGWSNHGGTALREFYRNAPAVHVEGKHVLSYTVSLRERFHHSVADDRIYSHVSVCPGGIIHADGRDIEFCIPEDGCLTVYYRGGADADLRRRVSELLSFLWGRRLLKVGEQREETGEILSVSISPDDAQRALGQDTVMPIEHPTPDGCPSIRPAVTTKTQELIDGFLEAYGRYNLGYVMGLYFDATLQPPEAAIVRYQQVVEALVDVHFNDPKAEMIPPAEVDRIFGEQITGLRRTLDREFPDSAESIELGIRRAFIGSVNGRRNRFNEDLGIGKPPGIKTHTKRLNDLKHGRTVTHEEALETVLFYRTYCNRILLSIMGEKEYRDLSALKDTWDEQLW